MAKQIITVTKRVKKGSASSEKPPYGFHKCSSCGGTGIKQNVGRKPNS